MRREMNYEYQMNPNYRSIRSTDDSKVTCQHQ